MRRAPSPPRRVLFGVPMAARVELLQGSGPGACYGLIGMVRRRAAADVDGATRGDERRASLVQAGLQNAQRFDWSKNAEQVMAAYLS